MTANWSLPFDPADFIDKDIFTLSGIKDISEGQKSKIMAQMTETVNTRVLARILDSLDEAGEKELGEIADSGDQKKLTAFLLSKGIDLVKIASEEALAYKVELIAMMKSDKGDK